MATEIYVASISNGCAIAAVDGSKLAKEINKAAAEPPRLSWRPVSVSQAGMA